MKRKTAVSAFAQRKIVKVDDVVLSSQTVSEVASEVVSEAASPDSLEIVDSELEDTEEITGLEYEVEEVTDIPVREVSVDNRPPVTISSFQPVLNENIFEYEHSTIYGLVSGETLVLAGAYTLRVHKGCVCVAGSVIHASDEAFTIYAPNKIGGGSCALPRIECVQVRDLSRSSSSSPEELVDSISRTGESRMDRFRAVIKIGSLSSTTKFQNMRRIGNIAPPFKNLWSLSTTNSEKKSYESIYQIPANEAPPLVFSPPKSWTQACEVVGNYSPAETASDITASVTLVAGTKNSGKSAISRVLTNGLLYDLDAVAYLDLDPGQTLFSPPGEISLHVVSKPLLSNQSFTYSSTTEGDYKLIQSHHLGNLSPKDNPSYYLAMIAALFKIYKESLLRASPMMPLVINTPGWTRGLGLDLLIEITKLVVPSHIIFLGTSEAYDEVLPMVESAANSQSNVKVNGVRVLTPEPFFTNSNPNLASVTPVSSSDLRTLKIMHYLHADFDFSRKLSAVPPYQVRYGSLDYLPLGSGAISGVGIMGSEGIDANDVALALTGTVVGLLAVDLSDNNSFPTTLVSSALQDDANEDADNEYELNDEAGATDVNSINLPWILPEDIPMILDARTSRCLGQAVVHSINSTTRTITLMTPVAETDLAQVVTNKREALVLIRGRLPVPLWELWDRDADGCDAGKYLSRVKEVGAGAGNWRIRRNVMRRGYA
ncbi:hypothetical protein NADFUDRAFT_67344 [Nadsonia fulvescens var. elongata DSM 6958]|uniref:Polynucleotide 5'-hydroxyl-kinase GRC3 n=1 Tax=Nadsonia fulvescens var. elongata DSM 6958 TaxID=857566 RepID=A0A1E3PEY6_9ASCO|nr:hypothetical protein NADFUDRAFT_67344 [Nadsonia fulvescens var. elongata DSM 6958]